MSSRILLEPTFVLHAKPYRETSLLVNFFTKNHGHIRAIARSARGTRSRFKGCLVPFSPLLASFSGKTDLLQTTAIEIDRAAYFLQGNNLFNGFYLNELLLKLLGKFDSYPILFDSYQETLNGLQDTSDSQKVLRIFEKKLLAELGYGLQLSQDASGNRVMPDAFYFYHFEHGIVICNNKEEGFRGSHLLAIENNQFTTDEILKDAKKLMRLVFRKLLGDYTLKSRELFNRW
jgi:DNA repair protein RecO (recombination protein O)